MQQLIIVDTFGFFFRSFYALPPLHNSQGFPTGLLMGFANLIMKLHKNHPHDFIVFALEGRGENKRKEIYKDYKANRQEAPQDLLLQLPIAMEWIEKMGLVNISYDGYEADDAIASLAHLAKSQNLKTKIISHDKDLYQLIDEDTFLLDPIKNTEIHERECQDKFGVLPQSFVDYQSLVGDSSDNIPGVKGVGAKTACKLLEHFGTLDNIYAKSDELGEVVSARIANLIIENKQSAYISRDLATLKKDLIADFDFKRLAMPAKNPLHKIIDEMAKYEFVKIVQRLNGEPMNVKHTSYLKNSKLVGMPESNAESSGDSGVDSDSTQNPQNAQGTSNMPNTAPASITASSISRFSFEARTLFALKEVQDIIAPLPKDTMIAYDCETTDLDTSRAKIVGFSFCIDGKNAYYVPIAHSYLGAPEQMSLDDVKIALEMIFAHPLIGHNLKYDLKIAQSLGIKPAREIYDSMVLAWLYDSASKVGLDEQMRRWFSHEMITFGEVVGSNQNFSEVIIESATKYAAEDAAASMALFFTLQKALESKGLHHLITLANELEYPFIYVLMEMEQNGIKVDIEHFKALSERFGKELSQIEQEIFALSGAVFNVNSTKQLGSVLFENLKLKAQRQIKGGYSTDEKTLLALIDAHPVIAKIIDYREAAKLRNTYVEPILKLNKQGRIHSSFLQTGTATGRLSSKAPNIQNIPVRTEQGKLIRAGFKASDENSTLLSIDYSQIELRLLAHFSQDKALVEAFENRLDIHLQTARIIFGDALAQQKRNVAKSINFGLIYGMGAQKLGQTLKIPQKEAKEYIQSYFRSFPTVKDFLKSKEEEILSLGYAQTLLGHRRYFDFSRATEFMKANFLREGINSIFQGSAADLIKMAMLKIYHHIKGTPTKMLLQIHDELIFELPKEGARERAQEISSIMDTIYTLNVPLESSITLGNTWAELK